MLIVAAGLLSRKKGQAQGPPLRESYLRNPNKKL